MKPLRSMHATLLLSGLIGAALPAWAQTATDAANTTTATTTAPGPNPDGFEKGPGSPFADGNIALYSSIHLGGFAGGYGSTSIPPLAIGGDYFIQPEVALGALLGFSQSTYNYGFLSDDYKWTYTYILMGVRGAYHFHEVVKNLPLDPYVGLTAGYNIVTVSGQNSSTASGSYTFFGAHLGGQYWFNPKLAAQLELGYGVGVLGLGIAYRL